MLAQNVNVVFQNCTSLGGYNANARATHVGNTMIIRHNLLLGFAASAIVLTTCLTATKSSAQNPPSPPPDVSLQENVVYGNADGVPLLMDIVRPKLLSGDLPVVLCIHGGGWSSGSKKDMHQLAYGITSLGFEAVSIDYRLSQQSKFPSQIDDVKTALNYLRTHAKEMKIDAKRIAALGASAGGHLALLLAESSASEAKPPLAEGQKRALQAVASIAGPTDFTSNLPEFSKQIITVLMGKPFEQNVKAYKDASPIFGLKADCAPLFLIHGDKDQLVPYAQATSMIAACDKAGVSAELFTLHNADHGGGGDPGEAQESMRSLAQFFQKHLQN